jgi:hypothetical protein
MPVGAVDALAFFDEMADAFASASMHAGIVERAYRIDGRVVRLRFAGPALVPPLCTALDHRAASRTAEPDLTVCLWDSESTACHMPITDALSRYSMRGELPALNTSRIYAVTERGYPSVLLFDRDRGLALYWVPAPSALPEWVRGTPLRVLLHWWLSARGKQLVHGAAVATDAGGVLITARSGSGKSTTALSCVAAGMAYAGDDYVIVGPDPPHAANVYCTAKIAATQLRLFPWADDMIANREALDEDKALIVLRGRYRDRIVDGFPLRAILIPSITGRPVSRVRPASAASALAALAPTTLLFHPRGGAPELKALSALVQALPAYVLECGTDVPELPSVISAFLERSRP